MEYFQIDPAFIIGHTEHITAVFILLDISAWKIVLHANLWRRFSVFLKIIPEHPCRSLKLNPSNFGSTISSALCSNSGLISSFSVTLILYTLLMLSPAMTGKRCAVLSSLSQRISRFVGTPFTLFFIYSSFLHILQAGWVSVFLLSPAHKIHNLLYAIIK